MNPDTAFPLKLCINLAQRADRWKAAKEEFAAQELKVERSPGISARQVRDSWGFQNERRYACSLAKRLAIRRACLAGVEAVLIFEDDIVLHPQWRERLAEIELPDDWGLFYLGCRHYERPEVVAPWLVRCRRATDNHAFAVRREHFRLVMRGMKGTRKGAPRTILYSDLQLAGWQDRIPAYAAFPNLVWQRRGHSDNSCGVVGWYDDEGCQIQRSELVDGIEAEMHRRWPERMATQAGNQEVGELRSGRISSRHADAGTPSPIARPSDSVEDLPTWDWLEGRPSMRRLEEAFSFRRYINLAHREDRRNEVEYQFAAQGLAVERSAAVDARHLKSGRGYGKVTEYACSFSHRLALREGWRSGADAVLVFEDDLVLHRRFREVAEALELPADWGILYFGCQHFEAPHVVQPGVVRVKGAWGMHAYAIRRRWLPLVRRELRGVSPISGGRMACDVALTKLASHVPTYAAYPNLAWQSPGHSSIRGHERQPFTTEGHQLWRPELLADVNESMKALLLSRGSSGESN